jgi:hypothetical protein
MNVMVLSPFEIFLVTSGAPRWRAEKVPAPHEHMPEKRILRGGIHTRPGAGAT